MMLQQSGSISGTIEELASLCICRVPQMQLAVEQLKKFKVANIIEQNGNIILTSRRRERDCKISEIRSEAGKKSGIARNKTSTSTEQRVGTPSSSASSSVYASDSEIPSWNEFWEYCQSIHCGLAAEWFARDKFEAANADRWKGKSDWRAYARRCKGWWQNDGSPMKPNQNHGNTNAKNGVQRIDRSIGTANEGIASRYKDFGKVVKPPNP
jgi:hypothetical protein